MMALSTRYFPKLDTTMNLPEKNTGKSLILMLHGFGQNAKIFRKSTGALRKELEKGGLFKCVYVDAPHIVPPDLEHESRDEKKQDLGPQRCWFWRTYSDNGDVCLNGLDESMRYLDRIISANESLADISSELHEFYEKSMKIRSVFGFSQGAVITHLLLAHIHNLNITSPFMSISHAVLASGYKLDPFLYADPVVPAIKSLHIYGDKDEIVKTSRSEQLTKFYSIQPKIMKHSGGHFIPQTREFRHAISSFFKQELID